VEVARGEVVSAAGAVEPFLELVLVHVIGEQLSGHLPRFVSW